MSDESPPLSCGECGAVWLKKGTTNCWSPDPDKGPARPQYCPTGNEPELLDQTYALYREESDDARLAHVAGRVEGMVYEKRDDGAVAARLTRVEEIVLFAKMMGYKKIGIATCIGLLDETGRFAQVVEGQGLTALHVCCKSGSVDKTEVMLDEQDKVRPGTFEPACNPIAQAELLNQAGTDMNVIIGLCLGHDMLFSKYSKAPVTTLVVKDRVTGHNPVCVLYGQNFYFKRLQTVPIEVPDE